MGMAHRLIPLLLTLPPHGLTEAATGRSRGTGPIAKAIEGYSRPTGGLGTASNDHSISLVSY